MAGKSPRTSGEGFPPSPRMQEARTAEDGGGPRQHPPQWNGALRRSGEHLTGGRDTGTSAGRHQETPRQAESDAPHHDTHPAISIIREISNYLHNTRTHLEAYERVIGDPKEDANSLQRRVMGLYENHQRQVAVFMNDLQGNSVLVSDQNTFDALVNGVYDKFKYVFLKLDMSIENPTVEQNSTDAAARPATVVSDAQTFGSLLKQYRKAARLSQREVAERADLTSSNVSQLETDSWEPRLNTILKLADALNIDPAALLPRRQPRQR